MKNIFKFLIPLAFISSAFAASSDDFTDTTKALQVTPASTAVVIKVKSNPTTGYSWFLVNYNENLLSPISHKYYPPTSQLVGASGYEIWRFRVNTAAFIMPQITTITLQYSRPWEVNDNDQQSKFTVVVNTSAVSKSVTKK